MGEVKEEGGGAEANGRARTPARTRPRACSPPTGSKRSRLPRLPGDEGRGGAQPGARRGRRREVRAAGVGDCGEGGAGARARPVEAAPPLRPRPGVWLSARACVPAVRAGRDAEVKFGREGESSVSAREPEWPPLLSPARQPEQGKGGGTGPPLVAGREGG